MINLEEKKNETIHLVDPEKVQKAVEEFEQTGSFYTRFGPVVDRSLACKILEYMLRDYAELITRSDVEIDGSIDPLEMNAESYDVYISVKRKELSKGGK